jgi:hypothetical protein
MSTPLWAKHADLTHVRETKRTRGGDPRTLLVKSRKNPQPEPQTETNTTKKTLVECIADMKKPKSSAVAPKHRNIKLPTEEGWWARHRGGYIDWFHVYQLNDASLAIFVRDLTKFIPVKEFSRPLDYWAGPVDIGSSD